MRSAGVVPSRQSCQRGVRPTADGLNGGYIALLLALSAVLVGLAMWGFQRRDVGV